MFKVEKGSQLLPINARKGFQSVEDLTAAELVEYNQVAATFAADFNTRYPHGKEVTVNIERIDLGDKAIIILAKHPDLSTQAIAWPYSVADLVAGRLGVGNADGLASLVLTTIEPLTMSMTVRAVTPGENYAEGKSYKGYQMTTVAGTREEIHLSDDAMAIVAEQHREIVKDSIRAATSNRRGASAARGRSQTPVAAVPAVVEEEVGP